MSPMGSQITSPMIVYSTIYSGIDQGKHQSSTSLASVRGIHWWPVNSPHKGPVTRKMFPFDDVIMSWHCVCWWPSTVRWEDSLNKVMTKFRSHIYTGPALEGFNSSHPGQNGCHFTDNIFKCIFINEKFCIAIQISLRFVAKGPINYANPVYGVATICHQVRWLHWGHPSLFHIATSILIWYKMFCVRDISYRLLWMELMNMFSEYAQSGTHSRFNLIIIVVLTYNPSVLMCVKITDAPKL